MKPYYILIILLGLSSCVSLDTITADKIKPNTTLSKLEYRVPINNPYGVKKFFLDIYKVDSTTISSVKIENNVPGIKILKDGLAKVKTIEISSELENHFKLKADLHSGFRVPYRYEYNKLIDTLSKMNLMSQENLPQPKKFRKAFYSEFPLRYVQATSNFQTITIPFKIRPKQSSLHSQISTGVNVGFSYAFKHAYKSYRPVSIKPLSSPIGYQLNEYEIGFAPFIGLTSVDLTPKNTNDEVSTDIKVFGIDVGGMITIGINKLDFGIAVGLDHGLSKASQNWIYQDKVWVGLVLGLDLIK